MAFNVDEYNKIFEAVKSNSIEVLDEEYKAGKITGAEYATVLSEILKSIVAQTAGMQQAQEKLEAETALKNNEVVKENELKDAKIKLILKQIDEIDNKLTMEKSMNDKNLELKSAEIDKIDANIKLGIRKANIEKEVADANIKLNTSKVNIEKEIADANVKLKTQEFDFNTKKYPLDINLEQNKIDLVKEQIEVEKQKILLETDMNNAQIQQITDNKYLDMFGKQLDAWSLMFTSGLLEEKPSIISDDRVTELYNHLANYN